jgi:hypothetical protein
MGIVDGRAKTERGAGSWVVGKNSWSKAFRGSGDLEMYDELGGSILRSSYIGFFGRISLLWVLLFRYHRAWAQHVSRDPLRLMSGRCECVLDVFGTIVM